MVHPGRALSGMLFAALALLSDVFNTDASTAPRLMWIFKRPI
jgi:hypothetical protein